MTWLRKHSLDLVALGIYCALTIVMTWPLVTQMSTHLAGDDVDAWLNPWATWWTRKVLSEGLNLYHTDYLFHPQGVSLAFHSFSHVNTALALMLEPLIGRIVAHNVTTLLAYALSGFSMYLLVNDRFRNRAAAFVAGIVFAFSPYHIDQTLHPVITSVQWTPLFLLFFIRVLEGKRIKDAIAAVVFLLLTALTSWHLFLFAVIAGGVYGAGATIATRRNRTRFLTRSLIVFVILAIAALLPLMWPMLREWFGDPSAYGTAPINLDRSQSLDLLAFFVPTHHHTLWGRWTKTIQLDILARRRSVFLGFCAMAIAIYGFVRQRQAVMLWTATGVVFWIFSLGPVPRLWGMRLPTLPWGAPLMQVFRASHRFHIMTTLAFAVLVGWGWHVAWETLSKKWSKRYLFIGTALVSAVILFEYLSAPIPTLRVGISPFVERMGEDPEDYAVADLPLGRRFGRFYMFQQMFHKKRLIEGVVSRPPVEAYAFIQGDAFWARLLEDRDVDTTLRDVSRHLAYLSEENVRYVIIHRDVLTQDRLARWRDYFTITPLYEDDMIIVYTTRPEAGRDFELVSELGAGVGLIRASVTPVEVVQDGSLSIGLRWGSRTAPGRDLSVCLALVNGAGETSQEMCKDPVDGWPTSEWPGGAVGIGEYVFPVDQHLPGGKYTLAARLIESETGRSVGEAVALETITFKTLLRVFDAPVPQRVVSETFGEDLSLLGYDIAQEDETLRLMLHWQAERRMSQYYKFFVHLLARDTLELVAQTDWVPRNWTYPTHWWEAGEVVSEEVVLPLAEVPEGQYVLAVGVYIPRGERLRTDKGTDRVLLDEEIAVR
jgi:hypothetical protein